MVADCCKDYFLCEHHEFHCKTHHVYVRYKHKGKDGKEKDGWTQGFELTMPVNSGPESNPNEST